MILRFYVLATGVVGALPGLRPVKVLPRGEVPEAKGPRPALHPTRPHSQEAGVLHELQRGHLHPNKTGLPGTVAWVTITARMVRGGGGVVMSCATDHWEKFIVFI